MRSIQFLKARKDSAKMLQFIDETFHQVALTIPALIIFPLLFGLRMRRYHDFYALFQQAIDKILRRIAPICDNPFTRQSLGSMPLLA